MFSFRDNGSDSLPAHRQAHASLAIATGLLMCCSFSVSAHVTGWAPNEPGCDPLGPFAPPGDPQPPEMFGEWSEAVSWPTQATHMVMLHTGKVLWWRSSHPGTTYVWDPTTGQNTSVNPPSTNLFCAGHTTMADGRVIAIGGTVDLTNNLGSPDTNIFDPQSETWTQVASMMLGRWYPTATTLPDGRILAMSGGTIPGESDAYPGTSSIIAKVPEIYDAGSDTWTALPGGSRRMSSYPYNFVTASGDIFSAGPGTSTRILDTELQQWTTVASAANAASTGSAAMYSGGKILKVGGSSIATDVAEIIDLNAASPAWQMTDPMLFPRRRPDMVLLPDGQALVIGGSTATQNDPQCAVHAAEMWAPDTGRWTLMASSEKTRIYHSAAVLLPDGRVLSAGGERMGTGGERNMEIFSPPYLFAGPRPLVNAAPPTVAYGTAFAVATDSEDVQKITLVRPGSVTHNFDQNQRFLSLNYAGTQSLTVDAPANANLAPPGYYMMFLVNAAGVPSVAHWLLIQDSATQLCESGKSSEAGASQACIQPTIRPIDLPMQPRG